MTKTLPAEFINQKRTGYFLAALLSAKNKDYIETILNSLNTELPNILWLIPKDTLHITLCEIIRPSTDIAKSESLFNLHKKEFLTRTQAVLNSFNKIQINFNSIEASQNAIIVRGTDNGTFSSIRKQLQENLPLPEDVKIPNIIHTSIARYIQGIDLQQVQKIVSDFKVNFEELITEFNLIKVLISPLIEYEIVQKYSLRNT